jgi:hypothetical protein
VLKLWDVTRTSNKWFNYSCYRNPSIGLATKAKGCKVASQREAGSHVACFRECKRVWGNRPSHSQGNSHFGSWSLGGLLNFQSAITRVKTHRIEEFLYIIGKLLKHKCLKWARMTHLDIWNTSYGQKKGRESNWQFDSQPLNVGNRPDFLACRWRVTCNWKALNEGYNFDLDLISIGGLHTKLWGPKVARIPTLAISHLGVSGQKNHLDVGLVERHKVYYKGEGGGFPQVWVMVNLMTPSFLWLVLAPKVLQLCTNHFVLVLCKSMWVVEACQFFLVPSRSSSKPLYPSKVLKARECAPNS